MIDINLTPGERQKGAATYLGINPSLINIKLLIPFIILVYVIEGIVSSVYEPDIVLINEKIKSYQTETRKKGLELRQYDSIKEKVKQLKIQRKNLKEKIEIVKEIVDKRQNPYAILKYIADNTPDNVWVTKLSIDKNQLILNGHSKSWKNIGLLIENLKNSIFFNGNVDYQKGVGLKESNLGGNIKFENFKITTEIVSYK